MQQTAVLILLTGALHTAPEWADEPVCPAHLATIEPDGRVSSGSKHAVRVAVRAGLPLRVGWGLDVNGDAKPLITHSRARERPSQRRCGAVSRYAWPGASPLSMEGGA
jgi:hypothetical protein